MFTIPEESSERGSASVFLAVAIIGIMVFFGLAVDGSGQIATMQRAHNLAAQAARVGGQQVNAGDVQAGRSVRLLTGDAVSAARSYVAGSEATSSTVEARNGSVVVNVTLTYQCRFLNLIGINSLRVTGESEARIAPALNGNEIP